MARLQAASEPVVRVEVSAGSGSLAIRVLAPSLLLWREGARAGEIGLEQGQVVEIGPGGAALVAVVSVARPGAGGGHTQEAPPLAPGMSLRLAPRGADGAGGAGGHQQGLPAAAFGLHGKEYPGELQVAAVPQPGGGSPALALTAINLVALETYLSYMLGCEMPLGWPPEALKAQAVAARTFTLHRLLRGRGGAAASDVFSDTRSQVYRGCGGIGEELLPRARAAVASTRGQVLTWRGEPVEAFYHSTCGGDTVPPAWGFGRGDGDSDAMAACPEPLRGASGCACGRSTHYRWVKEAELSVGGDTAAREAVLGRGLTLPLKEVTVEHRLQGSHVARLHLADAGGRRAALSGPEARTLFGLKSAAFSAQLLGAAGTGIRFEGRGFGHGVGLCQWGAEGFAQKGWGFQDILRRAFPGAELSATPWASSGDVPPPTEDGQGRQSCRSP